MLDEYKNLYTLSAEPIKNWRTIDKNELCRLCIKYENDADKFNSYLSALILRYWNLIGKFYNMSQNLAEPIDCYDWLIHSIMYALKHRQWENPESAVYNDPKGPDKVINRCMKSSRLIFYQFKNRKKRKKEFQIVSIDELKDSINSGSIDIEDESFNIDTQDIDMRFFINQTFGKKEYFLSFILDCICNEDIFDNENGFISMNPKKLAKRFKSIDDRYLNVFSKRYDLDHDDVYQAAILAKNIPEV